MKLKQKISSMILIFALILICIPTGTIAQAETKAKLEQKKITTGIGSYSKDTIELTNKIDNAVYTFSSSNTKIVKVGNKTGILSGIKAGKANIIVKQTYKKKTLSIGTCSVTVTDTPKKADRANDEMFITFSENAKKEFYIEIYFDHINSDAVYTVQSSDSSVITLSGSANNKNDFTLSMETKKAGDSTLTIKQLYKGKTKSIGSITVKVSDVSIDEPEKTELTYTRPEMFPCYVYIYYPDGNKKAKIVSSDESVVAIEEETTNSDIKGFQLSLLKKGTVTLTYYEGDTIIGEKKVIVESVDVTEAKYSEGTGDITYEMRSDSVFANDSIEFELTPENANGEDCTAVIADESICSVEGVNGFTGYFGVDLDIKKVGTTTITIKNGEGKVIYTGNLTIIEHQEE